MTIEEVQHLLDMLTAEQPTSARWQKRRDCSQSVDA